MTNAFDGLEPRALWAHFDAIRSIPRPSGKEEKIRAHILAWAARKGFRSATDAVQNVVSQISVVIEGRYTGRQGDYSVGATNRAEGPVVTLTPEHPAMRKMMAAIEIHLAPDLRSTRRVVLREADGDFTDITFSEQVANPPLPAGTFDLSQPAELERIRQAVQPRPGGETPNSP